MKVSKIRIYHYWINFIDFSNVSTVINEAIITYYESLQSFIEEIQTGVFIQFSLESMFQIVEGKQLIS